MEDGQIIELYWRRDEAAIRETEARYGARLLAVTRHILDDREDSRESVNDTYLAAWQSMPPQRPERLSTYLGKLVRRISVSMLRRRTAKKRGGGYEAVLDELSQCVSGDDPQSRAECRELGESISRWLAAQEKPLRTLFLCRYFFCDSLRDAAACCGMGQAQAGSALYRARLSLRAHLESEGYTV